MLTSALNQVAERIAESGEGESFSPRQILDMVGAQRRGTNVNTHIRALLARHSLSTSPDIGAVGLDERVTITPSNDVECPQFYRELQQANQSIEGGQTPTRTSVRTLLGWFGASRRGTQVVATIESALAGFNLATRPDFRNVHIDADVEIVRPAKPEPETSSSGAAVGDSDANAPASEPPPAHDQETQATASPREESVHEAFRVGTLAEATRDPLFQVAPSTPIDTAVTTMLAQGVSHLPVMQGNRSVKGMLRWKDIAKYLAVTTGSTTSDPVSKAMSQAYEAKVSDPFLNVIPLVLSHGCVLVRNEDNCVSGIITKRDLGANLQSHAAPFVVLGEIERSLRALMEKGCFTELELKEWAQHANDERPVKEIEDLTLGQCHRLLSHEEAWARLSLRLDRKVFCRHLDDVRRVRNDVMHFDPDSPTADDKRILDRFLELLYELRRLTLS